MTVTVFTNPNNPQCEATEQELSKLGVRYVAVDLTPLDVECAWPVFKATAIGCEPMFVKVTNVLCVPVEARYSP